jgi:hypothetical protein
VPFRRVTSGRQRLEKQVKVGKECRRSRWPQREGTLPALFTLSVSQASVLPAQAICTVPHSCLGSLVMSGGIWMPGDCERTDHTTVLDLGFCWPSASAGRSGKPCKCPIAKRNESFQDGGSTRKCRTVSSNCPSCKSSSCKSRSCKSRAAENRDEIAELHARFQAQETAS